MLLLILMLDLIQIVITSDGINDESIPRSVPTLDIAKLPLRTFTCYDDSGLIFMQPNGMKQFCVVLGNVTDTKNLPISYKTYKTYMLTEQKDIYDHLTVHKLMGIVTTLMKASDVTHVYLSNAIYETQPNVRQSYWDDADSLSYLTPILFRRFIKKGILHDKHTFQCDIKVNGETLKGVVYDKNLCLTHIRSVYIPIQKSCTEAGLIIANVMSPNHESVLIDYVRSFMGDLRFHESDRFYVGEVNDAVIHEFSWGETATTSELTIFDPEYMFMYANVPIYTGTLREEVNVQWVMCVTNPIDFKVVKSAISDHFEFEMNLPPTTSTESVTTTTNVTLAVENPTVITNNAQFLRFETTSFDTIERQRGDGDIREAYTPKNKDTPVERGDGDINEAYTPKNNGYLYEKYRAIERERDDTGGAIFIQYEEYGFITKLLMILTIVIVVLVSINLSTRFCEMSEKDEKKESQRPIRPQKSSDLWRSIRPQKK